MTTERPTSRVNHAHAGTVETSSSARARAVKLRRVPPGAVVSPWPGTLRFYGRVSRSMVGISLLTLVPQLSGGSETYARELVRALARVGRLQYHVFTPSIASDASDGLPGTTVGVVSRLALDRGTAAGDGSGERSPRQAAAAARLGASERAPLPAHPCDSARQRRARRHVDPRPPARALPGVLLTCGARLPPGRVPGRGPREQARDRDQRARQGDDRRAARRRAGAGAGDLPGDRPRAAPPRRGGARPVPALPRQRLAAQEPRAAARGVCPAPARAAGAAARPDRFRARAPARAARASRSADTCPATSSCGSTGRPSALVFPSLYEGFGLPPLEAMASGCPVASSDAGALPEVLGDAPAYFDPTDPEAIAAAVLRGPGRPAALRRARAARAREFTWDACAREHDDVYEELSAA